MTDRGSIRAPRHLIRAIADDARGLALVEFALVLPVLLVLYLGGFQLEDGISCNRKVTTATRAAADLVSQNLSGTTTAAEIDGDLGAATRVLEPYPSSAAVVRVTEITTDLSGKSTVQWSRAKNGNAYTKGAVVTIPLQMRLPGTYYIFSEISYSYAPNVNFGFLNPMTLRDSLYMLPRNSNKIDCPDC